MTNCTYCNEEITGNFCAHCGSPKEPQRINGSYIINEISSVLNFDKGLFFTIREFFIRPGETAKRFIAGDRKRIVKPIIFLIICSLIYTVGQQYFSYKVGLVQYGDFPEDKRLPIPFQIYEWLTQNLGYGNILMAVFIAIWIKIFFRKHKYNYYEIYILLCFTVGITLLIFTLLGIVEGIFNFPVFGFAIPIVAIYTSWAIGQFFDRKKKLNYVKGFLSYTLGIMTSLLLLLSIGFGLEKLLH